MILDMSAKIVNTVVIDPNTIVGVLSLENIIVVIKDLVSVVMDVSLFVFVVIEKIGKVIQDCLFIKRRMHYVFSLFLFLIRMTIATFSHNYDERSFVLKK